MFVRALGIRALRAPIRDAETFPLVPTEDELREVSRGAAVLPLRVRPTRFDAYKEEASEPSLLTRTRTGIGRIRSTYYFEDISS